MVKSAFLKNILRTMTNDLRQYFAIVTILVLGSACFIGLRSTSPAMQTSLDNYFNANNVHDINIIDANPINPTLNNIEIMPIQKLSEVNEIASGQFSDLYAGYGNNIFTIRVHSLPTSINQINLYKGNMPQKNECIIDKRLASKHNLGIGSVLSFSSIKELNPKSFIVSGIADSPIYVSEFLGNSTMNTELDAFAYILPEEMITLPALIYHEIYLTLNHNFSRFSKKYQQLVEKVSIDIENILNPASNSFRILDLNSNAGFANFKGDSNRIAKVGNVFPIIFYLVAILVSFTTMVRLVENERTSMGTLCSLGISKKALLLKYAIYSLFIAFPAGLLGIAFGFWFFPTIIYRFGYKILYTLPKLLTPIVLSNSLITMALAIFSILLPTLIITTLILKEKPSELLRPKAPKPGRKNIFERSHILWKMLTFNGKVTTRNIFRSKRKAIMTIVGITGCTAIILAGFGLNNSIRDISRGHFDQLNVYDFRLNLYQDTSTIEYGDLTTKLDALESIENYTGFQQISTNVYNKKRTNSLEAYIVIPEDELVFNNYIKFRTPSKKTEFRLQDKAVISQKMSYQIGIKVGDFIDLELSNGSTINIEVGAVTENYIYHYVYLPKSFYNEKFQDQFMANTILGKYKSNINENEKEELSIELKKLSPITSIEITATAKNYYNKLINSLGIIVLVLIFCGGLLAFVVLFCLSGMNIEERKRELATLKVLGFYEKETALYIFWENLVLTLIGIAIGLISGIFLHKFILSTTETDNLMFGKYIHLESYIYSFILTFSFMWVVNFLMRNAIKKIDMIESLKNVE